MNPIGFSTGAVAKSDYHYALRTLRKHRVRVVELSALRIHELASLVSDLEELDLRDFDFVSFHAPSRFTKEEEAAVLFWLHRVVRRGLPVVVHPDVIYSVSAWSSLEAHLLIENMDKRKPVGRTARDLSELFDLLPAAGLCFDLGHARQVDPTMTEARLILETHVDRLREIHISEVNSDSRHDPISSFAIAAFRSVSALIPNEVPVVLETLIDQGQSDVLTEMNRARGALIRTSEAVAV